MVMPRHPVAHLVVGQARLPLGSFETSFDPMRRLGHAGQFLQWHPTPLTLWLGEDKKS